VKESNQNGNQTMKMKLISIDDGSLPGFAHIRKKDAQPCAFYRTVTP